MCNQLKLSKGYYFSNSSVEGDIQLFNGVRFLIELINAMINFDENPVAGSGYSFDNANRDVVTLEVD